MSAILKTVFRISLDESWLFARISGDYNPVHLDEVVARGTRFEGTIVHGVHLFVRAVEEVAAQGMLEGRQPALISGTFKNPVHTSRNVGLSVKVGCDELYINASSGNRPAFSGTVKLQSCGDADSIVEDAEFPIVRPCEDTFPPNLCESIEPVRLSRALLLELFPALAARSAAYWMADLLATTRIAGMRCPGMNAIYVSFKLTRTVGVNAVRASMQYRIAWTERRYRLLRLRVTGNCLEGVVDTMVR